MPKDNISSSGNTNITVECPVFHSLGSPEQDYLKLERWRGYSARYEYDVYFQPAAGSFTTASRTTTWRENPIPVSFLAVTPACGKNDPEC